jgi:hypothetical protein
MDWTTAAAGAIARRVWREWRRAAQMTDETLIATAIDSRRIEI